VTLEEVSAKVIPPLIVSLVLTLSGVVITVYIIKAEQEDIKRQNMKQWEFISKLTETSIRNEEKINIHKGDKCSHHNKNN